MRRILIVMALLAGGATLSAQERATIMRNDGERISGIVQSNSELSRDRRQQRDSGADERARRKAAS